MSSPSAGRRASKAPLSREVVVLGARGVGKSALVVRFVDDFFVDSYNPTIESTFVKQLKWRSERLELHIRDTTGQDEYSTFDPRYAVGVHGFVLVFSVANKQSLQIAKMVHSQVLNSLMGTSDAVPRVLVGTMTDLESERMVSADEGRAVAEEWGCPYIEVSAKSDVNVGEAFRRLVANIQRQHAGVQVTTSSGCSPCGPMSARSRSCVDRSFLPCLGLLGMVGVSLVVSAVRLVLDADAYRSLHALALTNIGFGALSLAAAAVGVSAALKRVEHPAMLKTVTRLCLTLALAEVIATSFIVGLSGGAVTSPGESATLAKGVGVCAGLAVLLHVVCAIVAQLERRVVGLMREEGSLLATGDSWA